MDQYFNNQYTSEKTRRLIVLINEAAGDGLCML